MTHLKALTYLVAPLLALMVLGTTTAQAEQIYGTINKTWTIYEDSELVDNVTCVVEKAPCIAFGAPGITLKLNGFTITGRAKPPGNCTPTEDFFTHFEDGIDVVEQQDASILGPGLVQKFARLGIFLGNSKRVRVEGVTASDNCFSGMFLSGTSESDITHNVWVRNALGSNGFPCGGT